MLKTKRKFTNSLRSDNVNFRFNAKLRNLRTSKSLQSQNPQTLFDGCSPRFPDCVSRFLNLLTLVQGYVKLSEAVKADVISYVIAQPQGIVITDLTVRASGELPIS